LAILVAVLFFTCNASCPRYGADAGIVMKCDQSATPSTANNFCTILSYKDNACCSTQLEVSSTQFSNIGCPDHTGAAPCDATHSCGTLNACTAGKPFHRPLTVSIPQNSRAYQVDACCAVTCNTRLACAASTALNKVVGVAVNGVLIYAEEGQVVDDCGGYTTTVFDQCGASQTEQIYVYGKTPSCLWNNLGGKNACNACGAGGLLIGWAMDGLPIFGGYDACRAEITGRDSCGGKKLTTPWNGYDYGYFYSANASAPGISCLWGADACNAALSGSITYSQNPCNACKVVAAGNCPNQGTSAPGLIQYVDDQQDFDQACDKDYTIYSGIDCTIPFGTANADECKVFGGASGKITCGDAGTMLNFWTSKTDCSGDYDASVSIEPSSGTCGSYMTFSFSGDFDLCPVKTTPSEDPDSAARITFLLAPLLLVASVMTNYM